MNQIISILEKAADLIQSGHLVKHMVTDNHGGYCSVGALQKAGGQDLHDWCHRRRDKVLQDTALVLYNKGVAPKLGNPATNDWQIAWGRVVQWNNAPERTAAEVVEAMKQAAKELSNGATPL
jgi:hypothetical protein